MAQPSVDGRHLYFRDRREGMALLEPAQGILCAPTFRAKFVSAGGLIRYRAACGSKTVRTQGLERS